MFPLRLPAPVGRSPGNAGSVWVGSALLPPPPCLVQAPKLGSWSRCPPAPSPWAGWAPSWVPWPQQGQRTVPRLSPRCDQPRLRTAPRHSTQQKSHPMDRKKIKKNIYTHISAGSGGAQGPCSPAGAEQGTVQGLLTMQPCPARPGAAAVHLGWLRCPAAARGEILALCVLRSR